MKVPNVNVHLTKKQSRKVLEEAKLMKLMSFHPNCLTFHGYVCEEGYLALVSEVADASLERLLGDEAIEGLTTNQRVSLAAGIANALRGLHVQGVVHRDLKPANVLTKVQADGAYSPMVADFGLSRIRTKVSMLSTTKRTPQTGPASA